MPEQEPVLQLGITGHVDAILRQLGLNTNEPGLQETPSRVARYLREFCQPADLMELMKSFDYEEVTDGGQPMVIVRAVPLAALCEHHLCPFFGQVDVGYIPNKRVVGLSKIARLASAAGRMRPTIQERLTNQIADAVDKGLDAKGVFVVARCEHTCMTVRGVNTPGVQTITSAIRGTFIHSPQAREEFLSLTR